MIVIGEEDLICVRLDHGKGCEERLAARVDALGTWYDCPRCGMSFLKPNKEFERLLEARRRGKSVDVVFHIPAEEFEESLETALAEEE